MAEVSRRKLLGSALGAGGLAAAASLLPPNLRRAMAEPLHKPGSLDDIEHLVVLMQENRSFDHYFGTMPGVRGFDDPNMAKLPDGRSVLYQPDGKNPDGYLLPFHLDTRKTSAQAIPSTSHAWNVQHSAFNHGAMDNWLPAHRKADGDADGPYTMGYYDRGDIPFHFALAESFTICDAYHSSILGPTWPNRFYHWTGMVDPNGTGGGPVISNVVKEPYRWTTYPERLTAAGVSWHVYQEEDDYGCNPLEFFKPYQDSSPHDELYRHGMTIGAADRFAYDAKHDRLPTISWIVPTSPQCEHPDYLPASGADYVARQLDAVAANPDVWHKTLFILNYDENDGLFDHVVPPTPPEGTPDEFVDGLPIGAGVRVPCMLISPWTQGGFVASEPFDHTSVLRFMERLTGVRESNISAWRRKTFGDLTSALGFSHSRRFPPLPPTKPLLWRAEREVATLPPAQIPGKDQTPPHQGPGRDGAPSGDESAPATLSGSRAQTRSRVEENLTNHSGDFTRGVAGTSFPGILAAARGSTPTGPGHAYVPGIVNYTISIIDTGSYKLVGGIDGGTNPYGIAKTPDGAKLYVSNSGASDVSVVDTAKGEISSSVTVGLYPHGIVISPDGNRVYVANTGPDTGRGGSHTVSVINTGTDKVVATWHVGLAPHALAVSPDGKRLYATCFDGLSIIDTRNGSVRGRMQDQSRAGGVAVGPDGARAYVVNTWRHTLSVVDTATRHTVACVPVGDTPWSVALSPDGTRAYVTNANADTVSVVETAHNRVAGTVTVGHIPTGVTAGADTVWVTNNAASTVTAIDAASLRVAGTTPLGLSAEPSAVALV